MPGSGRRGRPNKQRRRPCGARRKSSPRVPRKTLITERDAPAIESAELSALDRPLPIAPQAHGVESLVKGRKGHSVDSNSECVIAKHPGRRFGEYFDSILPALVAMWPMWKPVNQTGAGDRDRDRDRRCFQLSCPPQVSRHRTTSSNPGDHNRC